MIIPKEKYRIMTFNIRQFSDASAFHHKDKDSKKDLQTIAKIITENKIDIVAIQEIRGKLAFKELMSAIAFGYARDITSKILEQPTANGERRLRSETVGNDYLACTAGKWQGRWTHPNSKWGSGISEEGYAFIWNTERFELPFNGRGVVQPVIKHKKESYFVRPPFYGRFVTKTSPKFEIRLLNTHILYSKDVKYKKIKETDIDIELLNSPIKAERMETKKALLKNGLKPFEVGILQTTLNQDDVQRRRAEVNNLIKEILTREEDNHGNGSYVFMLGDYNLNIKESKYPYKNTKATIERRIRNISRAYNDSKVYIITQDELSTLRVPSKDGRKEEFVGEDRFANNYDHFTYNVEMNSKGLTGRDIYVGNPVRINAIDKYGLSAREYYERISDHLPVYMEIGF